MVKNVPEDVIDEGLERRWTIDRPEWHDEVFIVPCDGRERHLPLIPSRMCVRLYALHKTKFCVIPGSVELFEC